MLLLKRVLTRLLRKKSRSQIDDLKLSPALQRDIGVSITRVRLPSGVEVVVVFRLED